MPNIIRRVGGSLGSAVFVVILENHGGSGAAAFHTTFWWLSAASGLALSLAIWLTVKLRRS